MPIYEYECPKCGWRGERNTSLKKRPSWIACGKCFSKAKLIISETHFQLNGTGWAKDGYGKGKK